jgi:hydrogenase maturation protease
MTKRTLFLAYGNPDRQDDGVAWYVLQQIGKEFKHPVVDWNTDFYEELGQIPDFFFTLQLTPELNELLSGYDQICFIDAHLGVELGDLEMMAISPNFEPSTLSHHMTPQFLLDITRTNKGKSPNAVLLTIRGFEFQFVQGLSPKTQLLADRAVQEAIRWYHSSQ